MYCKPGFSEDLDPPPVSNKAQEDALPPRISSYRFMSPKTGNVYEYTIENTQEITGIHRAMYMPAFCSHSHEGRSQERIKNVRFKMTVRVKVLSLGALM